MILCRGDGMIRVICDAGLSSEIFTSHTYDVNSERVDKNCELFKEPRVLVRKFIFAKSERLVGATSIFPSFVIRLCFFLSP